jgi:choice-of-anchor B domain-containing protein
MLMSRTWSSLAALAIAGSAHAQFQAQGIQLLAHVDLPAFSASSGNSCWGWVSPGGREYAVMGLNNKVSFVDITNPSSPVIRTNISHTASLWADVKVYSAGGQTYCYVTNESGGGLQVINMTNLDTTGATLVGNVTANGLATAHTCAINEASGHLYLCGANLNGGSLIAMSLANPAAPVEAGRWAGPYVHEAQVVTYTSGPYAGREIAFCHCEENGLYIVDVTNKSNMFIVGSTTYPGVRYCHQGWLSDDRRYIYVNDELDGPAQGVPYALTRVIDVQNLASPFLASTFSGAASGAIDHNLYVRGRYIYESNYRSGLRVFDTQGAGTPTAPVEVAWIDTYPEDDAPNYNGTWSNYPFFPSGTIIISDIDRGLFVVRLQLDYLTFTFPAGLPSRLQPGARTPITVEINTTGTGVDPTTVTLWQSVDTGPFTPTVMTPIGEDRYSARLQAIPCGSTARYYITARNTVGDAFASPNGAPGAGTYSAMAYASIPTLYSFDMETDAGWARAASGDTATTGLWERGDPEPTTAQPDDDHTPAPGVNCWVTGRLAGAVAGSNDVDGGFTTLLSPVLDLSGMGGEARIGYWRWYSNSAGGAPNADTFRVDISSNAGASWTNAETVGPSGPGTSGGWIYHEFRVADISPPTNQMRVRFIAEDAGQGSLIEAAVDDFSVFFYDCFNLCPAITQQPASQQAVAGSSAMFTVLASAPGALSYQWSKDNVPLADGSGVSGATTATLVLTGVDLSDAGSYDCLVTASCGSILSNAAILDVNLGCDPDVNCDGSADGFDVETMEQAVGGDFANFCQADADFNRDGSVDGFDVEAVEQVVGGSLCP